MTKNTTEVQVNIFKIYKHKYKNKYINYKNSKKMM